MSNRDANGDADGADAQLTPIHVTAFSDNDLMSLPNYHIYLKVMIDGEPSKPFNAVTLPASSMSWSPASQDDCEA